MHQSKYSDDQKWIGNSKHINEIALQIVQIPAKEKSMQEIYHYILESD